jgi:hypothetical protein
VADKAAERPKRVAARRGNERKQEDRGEGSSRRPAETTAPQKESAPSRNKRPADPEEPADRSLVRIRRRFDFPDLEERTPYMERSRTESMRRITYELLMEESNEEYKSMCKDIVDKLSSMLNEPLAISGEPAMRG